MSPVDAFMSAAVDEPTLANAPGISPQSIIGNPGNGMMIQPTGINMVQHQESGIKEDNRSAIEIAKPATSELYFIEVLVRVAVAKETACICSSLPSFKALLAVQSSSVCPSIRPATAPLFL